jgi:hypothetical protein
MESRLESAGDFADEETMAGPLVASVVVVAALSAGSGDTPDELPVIEVLAETPHLNTRLTASDDLILGTSEGALWYIDPATGDNRRIADTKGRGVGLAIFGDTAYVSTFSPEERGYFLHCVDIGSRQMTQTLRMPQLVSPSGVLPDGRILDASRRVFDLETGQITDQPLFALEPRGEFHETAEVQVHGWRIYVLYNVGALPQRGRLGIADARAPEKFQSIEMVGGVRHLAVTGDKAFVSALHRNGVEVYLVDLVERNPSRLIKSPMLRGDLYRDPQIKVDSGTGHILAFGNDAIYELSPSGASLARTPLSTESGLSHLSLLNVRDGHAICATGSHIIRLDLAKAVAAVP